MKKLHEVIMLPTEECQTPFITIRQDRYGELDEHPSYKTEQNDGRDNPQHLYIVSDEAIKEGDWCISGTEIFKSKTDENATLFKKIIATTDNELQGHYTEDREYGYDPRNGTGGWKEGLPQIPDSFIKEYVEAQGIDEVEVEYTGGCCGRCIEDLDVCEPTPEILKLDKDSYINISSTKTKTYTIEEVVHIIARFASDHPKKKGVNIFNVDIRNWVKKNL